MSNCEMCRGQLVITLDPGNLLVPCVRCSGSRNLEDIEKELGGKFELVDDEWCLVGVNLKHPGYTGGKILH